jgi:hypothetical protein
MYKSLGTRREVERTFSLVRVCNEDNLGPLRISDLKKGQRLLVEDASGMFWLVYTDQDAEALMECSSDLVFHIATYIDLQPEPVESAQSQETVTIWNLRKLSTPRKIWTSVL